jgi:very-short-patch-repair endonuclease
MRRRARALRRDATPTEQLLWRRLRARSARFKFRRQHVVDNFVLDFYCAEARLAVELDGQSHLTKLKRDARRARHLESLGLEILRFWDTEVYEDVNAVVEAIYGACERRIEDHG